MNAFPITERMLDRLVDGELTGDEYRDVLARLDLEPDGWRRCALVFLEAQAWKRELAPPRRETQPTKQVQGPVAIDPVAVKPIGGEFHWPGLILAMAASFVLAFGLGWGFGGRRGDEAGPSGPSNAKVVGDPVAFPGPSQGPSPPPSESPLPIEQPKQDETTPVAHDTTSNQGEITLLVEDGAGKHQEVQLPVVQVNSADDIARSLGASALPARIREALERSGHRVVRQQQVIPVELQDGRQLVMPVEDVRVVPAAIAYQ